MTDDDRAYQARKIMELMLLLSESGEWKMVGGRAGRSPISPVGERSRLGDVWFAQPRNAC
jgi:hypothetical protein